MLGASLWLVPPKDSQLDLLLSHLIKKTVPKHFPELICPPDFLPHLTLTSDIPVELVSKEPQAWLDGLLLTLEDPPRVIFQSLDVGEAFFKKLTLSAARGPLYEIATQIRAAAVANGDAEAAEQWARDVYAPHVSLLYAELSIGEEKRMEVLHELEQAGVKLETEGTFREEKGMNGWTGGRIVLVSTWKDLRGWSVVAERLL